MDALAREILDFWFGSSADRHAMWFHKDPAFDHEVRTRFGAAVDAALAGAYMDWNSEPGEALAHVLLLDQFTRNIYRDTPKAFAGDARALSIAQAVVDAGDDLLL